MNNLIFKPFDCRILAQTTAPNPKTTRNLTKTGRGRGYTLDSNPTESLLLRHRIAFAGREEEVHFESVLASVEVIVAAAQSVERLMRAALNDLAALDDEDLVCAADGR